MLEPSFLSNQFIIAMPGLEDPNFSRTVAFICEHNEDGALGLVINRTVDLSIGELLEHMSEVPPPDPIARQPVFMGGPVQRERGFVLHHPLGDWDATLAVSPDLGLTTSRDILLALGRESSPQQVLVALGYAGWGPGQLEQEMGENAWLSAPADPRILFELPVEERWEAAVAAMGVDLRMLSGDAGHA